MSNAHPSSGGIAMILERSYGSGAIAAAAALLMVLSMVINESLVARTFGTYALRPFDLGEDTPLVPALGVALIAFVYVLNPSGNRTVGLFAFAMALLKIGGVALFGAAALWAGGVSFAPTAGGGAAPELGFIASAAFSILAFKGFTTITNSGAEVVDPHRNVGRAITISITICVAVYLLVALAVSSGLTIDEVVAAKDYALAEAARPTLGIWGFYFTVALAVVATVSGLLASVFAVSRMLTMLTEMKMIPHSHFGMTGPIHGHLMVYTVVTAGFLTIFFDLSRIASLGAFFYLVMDIMVHWGVFRGPRRETGAQGWVLIMAIALDALVLGVFAATKLRSDPLIVAVAVAAIVAVFLFERAYPSRWIAEARECDH